MIRFISRRLLLSLPLLVAVTFISFLLLSLLPGNAASTILGSNATPQSLAAVNAQLGLNRPIYVQYWDWVSHAVRGDLGSSLVNHESVVSNLDSRLAVTLSLLGGALLLAVVVGIAIGVFTARRTGPVSRAVDLVAIAGFAVPSFWLAIVFILVFAVRLRLLPATGYVPFSQSPEMWLRFLVLPLVSLGIGMVTAIAKQTRESMLAVLGSPYIVSLRANGVSERRIVFKHALRNAAIPTVTVVSLLFVGSLTGAVVTEQVFSLPGLGSAAVSATQSRDISLVQGVALYLTLLVIAVNVLVDLAYGALNPKVRAR